MRVLCRHGHIAFYPRLATDIARFANFFSVTLKMERDYYTFEGLYGAPSYSLIGKSFLNLPAITTFEGNPWDVMKQNGFVFDVGLGILVPKLSVLTVVDMPLVGYYYRASGSLVQPGSRDISGNQILSYSGEFVDEGFSLKVSEFDYE